MKSISVLFIITLILISCTSSKLKKSKFLQTSTLSLNEPLKVMMIVYSGKANPNLTLEGNNLKQLQELIRSNTHNAKNNSRVIGYSGFLLTNNSLRIYIKGAPLVEHFLLNLMKEKHGQKLHDNVVNHARTEIDNGYHKKNLSTQFIGIGSESGIKITPNYFNNMNFNLSNTDNIFSNEKIDFCKKSAPIIGGQGVPKYDPQNDLSGCFEVECEDNNCYNYSVDVLTNTFAQPGKATIENPTDDLWDTCEGTIRASISDGLKFIGKDYPNFIPEKGHFVGLMMWGEGGFHWVRQDRNGKWSHKPGMNPIKNSDNDGKIISDPAIQNFLPWNEFCGYFLVVPNEINIK